ncbi:MAG TPA: malto-oligosyltrehalose synthase, partial [Candidatus Acidoferrales bacterium]
MRIPLSTYRLQFSIQFRFTDARDLVPYLHALGISDLYASPRFKARRGSSHGYDVADPQRISSELGTEEEFDELVQKLKSYGMGLLLDIVPNHMAASSENPWWMDVLENGPGSKYADYFDIEWHPSTTKAAFLQENRVLLPVLGDLYGVVLENQELSLRLDERGFYVRYYDHRFPVDPRSYRVILEEIDRQLGEAPDVPAEMRAELGAICQAVAQIPHFSAVDIESRERRQREGQRIQDRLWQLYCNDNAVRAATDEALRHLGGVRGNARSFDALDRLLSEQPYRLAHWKIGMEEINYRRFFDVNDLVGLRVEDPRVFADRHVALRRLVQDGSVTGVRVDHVDGLYDPGEYLQRLQQFAPPDGEDIFVIVEKILGEHEALPGEWPVAGTTGYDFLNAANVAFVDPAGLAALEATYARFTGSTMPFAEVCYAGNKKVMEQLFAGEVHALTHHLGRLAAQDRHARDLPIYELVQLLVEVTACLPVYRTYIRDFAVSPRDRFYIEKTLDLARSRTPATRVSDAALAFLRQVLLLEPPSYAQDQRNEYLAFVRRWQQFSGPVMAKGLEDTTLYLHNSLTSLNEVGSDPLRESLPLDVEAFHLFQQERQGRSPHSMNATSTHDTKRSEDMRARINVLSELAEDWDACLNRWSRWNETRRRKVNGHAAPAPHEEVLIYQTLLGVWPLEETELPGVAERVKAYMVKAAREGKALTSWMDPNEKHEAALEKFTDAILSLSAQNRFLVD